MNHQIVLALSARPTLQAPLEPMGSPLFAMKSFDRMLWIRTPGAPHCPRQFADLARSAFPNEGVGRLLRSRSISRLITPFICIPAYDLPVYASQWVSPPAHARLGTWLLARLCHGDH